MSSISNISKQTIDNLIKKNLELTPENYTKEFCKLAKLLKLSVRECQYFTETLSKINKDEFGSNNPESIYDLVDILIKRVPQKNIQNMSEMLQTSMKPSISLSIGDDLQSFCIQIGDSPSLIFEESIQQEMQRYIQNRFNVDQHILSQKTADIARLVSLMNKYLGDAIESNNDGSSTVKNIKKEIESICTVKSSREDLGKLQIKLVEAAMSIESEMSNVNKNLESGQSKVTILEEKIQALEKKLKETQADSKIDHLTNVLNRKSFEEELQKVENKFKREKEDFAIVFFDIDYFKKVNDTYGHDGGDIILQTFSALLLKLTRDTDIIARYGGEEFIAVLHYKESKELYKYIERIKKVVTQNKFIYQNNKIEITFSAGVELRSNCKTEQETITNADTLLYKAKDTGRNKVVFWDKKEI